MIHLHVRRYRTVQHLVQPTMCIHLLSVVPHLGITVGSQLRLLPNPTRRIMPAVFKFEQGLPIVFKRRHQNSTSSLLALSAVSISSIMAHSSARSSSHFSYSSSRYAPCASFKSASSIIVVSMLGVVTQTDLV